MRDSGSESELQGDAYLAIAGEDFLIHIIRIKRTKVITVLKGKQKIFMHNMNEILIR